jgi:hypothetical protein
MTAKLPADNPHMWIPYQGPEPYDEVCHLCGIFSGAHHKRSDPPTPRCLASNRGHNGSQTKQKANDTRWNRPAPATGRPLRDWLDEQTSLVART